MSDDRWTVVDDRARAAAGKLARELRRQWEGDPDQSPSEEATAFVEAVEALEAYRPDEVWPVGVRPLMDALDIPPGMVTDILIRATTSGYPTVEVLRGVPPDHARRLFSLLRAGNLASSSFAVAALEKGSSGTPEARQAIQAVRRLYYVLLNLLTLLEGEEREGLDLEEAKANAHRAELVKAGWYAIGLFDRAIVRGLVGAERDEEVGELERKVDAAVDGGPADG